MRILLTRLSSLGDIVHAMPLAKVLADAGHEVHWAVESPFLPLLEDCPFISSLYRVDTRGVRTKKTSFSMFFRQLKSLRDARPDVSIDPQGVIKSAVVGMVAGAPIRVGMGPGWRREKAAGLFYTKTAIPPAEVEHVIDAVLWLATALGIKPQLGLSPEVPWLASWAGSGEKAVVVPGAGAAAKLLGPEFWGEVASGLLKAGIEVMVAWGPGEEDLAQRVCRLSGAQMAPPTSIRELAVLFSAAMAVVGPDTGPVHLAAAVGVPTVAVFTATNPLRNGPRGPRVKVVSFVGESSNRRRSAASLLRPPSPAEVIKAVISVCSENMAHG